MPAVRPGPCCYQDESGEGKPGGRHHYRPGGGRFWGLLLVWIGVSLLLARQGIIPEDDWWKYFIIGLGVIFLIMAGLRRGRGIMPGVVLTIVGVAFLVGIGSWWPLLLIALGLSILLGSLFRR